MVCVTVMLQRLCTWSMDWILCCWQLAKAFIWLIVGRSLTASNSHQVISRAWNWWEERVDFGNWWYLMWLYDVGFGIVWIDLRGLLNLFEVGFQSFHFWEFYCYKPIVVFWFCGVKPAFNKTVSMGVINGIYYPSSLTSFAHFWIWIG